MRIVLEKIIPAVVKSIGVKQVALAGGPISRDRNNKKY